jgi:flagellum-specific ATP synthase
VLTRELADQAHFPAIDVLKSISRLRSEVVAREDIEAGRAVLRLMSTYKRVEDMVNIGAYQKGASPDIDRAIAMLSPINAFLQQHVGDNESLDACFAKLKELPGAGG